jgi:hypothetical protein
VTLRLYAVEDGQGRFIEDFPADRPIPAGYTARIDVTAKDEDEAETNGSGNVDWTFSDPGLVRVRGGHPFQKRLTAVQPGTVECQASLDGVASNVLTLTFQ